MIAVQYILDRSSIRSKGALALPARRKVEALQSVMLLESYDRPVNVVQQQFQQQPNSTALPDQNASGRPSCFGALGQIIWKTSMPNNVRTDAGGIYLGAPAYLFVGLRPANAPAIIQIQ